MNAVTIKSTVLPGTIKTELKALISDVKKEVSKYQGLVFAPEDAREAKKTLEDLRRYRKEIDGDRKAVKKAWMVPYTEFEGEVKVALGIIDSAIEPINSQWQEFEAQRIRDKKYEVDEKKVNLMIDSPVEQFMDAPWFDEKKWLNVSCPMSQVEHDILKKKAMIEEHIKTITGKAGEFVEQVLGQYFEHGDLAKALNYTSVLEEQARRVQAVREQQEQAMKDKLAQEARRAEMRTSAETVEDAQGSDVDEVPIHHVSAAEEAVLKEQDKKLVIGTTETPAFMKDDKPKKDPVMTVRFAATGKRSNLSALREFCEQHNITIARA